MGRYAVVAGTVLARSLHKLLLCEVARATKGKLTKG